MTQHNENIDLMRMQQFKVAKMKEQIQKLLMEFKQLEKEAPHNPKAAERLAKMQMAFKNGFDQDAFLKECEQLKNELKNPQKSRTQPEANQRSKTKTVRISHFA